MARSPVIARPVEGGVSADAEKSEGPVVCWVVRWGFEGISEIKPDDILDLTTGRWRVATILAYQTIDALLAANLLTGKDWETAIPRADGREAALEILRKEHRDDLHLYVFELVEVRQAVGAK